MNIDLIFECLSEEISPDEQSNAINHLVKNINILLKKQNIQHNEIEGYYTPKRLIIIICNIITDNSKENYIKGPSIDAPTINISNFAEKHNTTTEKLSKFNIKNKEFYGIAKNNLSITKTITEILINSLQTIKWKKNMRWGVFKLKWARPIHNIMYIINNENIKFKIGHIESNNTTYIKELTINSTRKIIKSINQYKQYLLDNNIIFNQNDRIKLFTQQIQNISKEHNLKILQKENVKSIALKMDFPHVFILKINQTLINNIPDKIIINVFENYDFIPMWEKDDSLSSKTATAININPTLKIINGYCKMLESRLMDALHIWQQSIIQDPELLYNKLHRISFYESLGSMAEKTVRITALAKYIAIWIPHAHIEKIEKAANMAKLDLTMNITKEFPKLQGVIGGMYASSKGLDNEISQAITEHYLPYGMQGNLPTTPAGIAIAIADKLDTLAGFFIINKQPTSSHDPFALRRATLSIIRILLKNNIDVPIEIIIHKATQLYPYEIRKTKLSTKLIQKININKTYSNKENIHIDNKIINFMLEKFISIILAEKKFNLQIILAITKANQRHSFVIIVHKIKELYIFMQSNTGQDMLNCYKRIYNILEQNKILNERQNINKELFTNTEEKNLSQKIKNANELIEKAPKNTLQPSLDILCNMLNYINTFLNKTIIITENHIIRQNRLTLLKEILIIFNKIAHFNYLLQTTEQQ